MKQQSARMMVAVTKITEAVICICTLGFYNPGLSMQSSIFFARRGWFAK